MSKNDMVMVPRELAQFIVDGGYCCHEAMAKLEAILISSSRQPQSKPAVDYGSMSAAERLAFCRGAEQHQGDPVAWLYEGLAYTVKPHSEAKPLGVLHAAQHEQVELKCFSCKGSFTPKDWSDCDGCCWKCGVEIDLEDYIVKLSVEVERLKRRVQNVDLELAAQTKQVHNLRAQLAERGALLRSLKNRPVHEWASGNIEAEIDAALSASAEPSAPTPIPAYMEAACDKFDWTPEEALRFYAEGKHFDTDNGRTRILCTGAIASHALKGMGGEYADMKGVEPSAPVECDERADFEAWFATTGLAEAWGRTVADCLKGKGCCTNSRWEGWQARAALEHKP